MSWGSTKSTTPRSIVGGKGAHLGELSRIEDIRVPPGFCVTTHAFERIMTHASIDERLERLTRLTVDDRNAIRVLSADIRQSLERTLIPEDMTAAITRMVARLGEDAAYAVRSSATAEDLPTASFAGQQDTYLNVVGQAAILEHVSRCWASLFTERAVIYRLRNAFEQRKIRMAVVVQRMVFPRAAGILFTADPITGNRKVASIDASFGLGEALVSGLVNADVYKVREDGIVEKVIAAKELAIDALPAGGTERHAIDPQGQRLGVDRYGGSCSSCSWAGESKRTLGALKTSNGAPAMMGSTSFRVGQSRRCFLSPRPTTGRTMSTYPSDISK